MHQDQTRLSQESKDQSLSFAPFIERYIQFFLELQLPLRELQQVHAYKADADQPGLLSALQDLTSVVSAGFLRALFCAGVDSLSQDSSVHPEWMLIRHLTFNNQIEVEFILLIYSLASESLGETQENVDKTFSLSQAFAQLM